MTIRSSLRAVAIAAVATGLGLSAASVQQAAAVPPSTVAEAQLQVDELNIEAAAIDQDYLAVQQQVTAGRKKLAQTQADVRTQQAKVAKLRKTVGQAALAQFQNRILDTTAELFLRSDTDTFLNQVSMMEQVNENQNTALQQLQAQQSAMVALERGATVEFAGLQTNQKSLADLRAKSDAKVAAAKTILAKLTAEERARIAAQRKAQQEEGAKAAAEVAAQAKERNRSATRQPAAPAATGASGTLSTPPGSSRGAAALAFAEKQRGKPYVFGATGPVAYDCSGLTLSAWKAAGVSIPRTSQQQISAGTPVSPGDLRPGDLVFFYPGIKHVGMYVGKGWIIHAPHPGAAVEYIRMSSMPFQGARRPG